MNAQPMQALERANEVRLARAALKREIKAEQRKVQRVLSEPFPSWLERMTVGQLLDAVPRLNHKMLGRLLAAARLSEERQLRFVTQRQRLLLIRSLDEREARLQRQRRSKGRAAA